MEISFLGAARTVTGSSFLISHDGFSVLVDLGLAQGGDEDTVGRELPVSPYQVDAVVLTHAHIDHSGRLPLLAKEGYAGPIYATGATRLLCSIMLADSAHIQESDAEWESRKNLRRGRKPVEPLYTAEDAAAAVSLFVDVEYGSRVELTPSLSFTMIDAGHLLGSASVRFSYIEDGQEKSLVFSGDIGNRGVPMLRDPSYFRQADFAVMESTYGDRLHEAMEGSERDMLIRRAEELARITDETFSRGGNLIIPSFAVGRTQEILYLFRMIMERKMVGYTIPVFLDSPLSVKATEVFSSCLRSDYFDDDARALAGRGINPILFPSLVTVTSQEDSKALNSRKESSVIISSSGMCEGGRIRHHLKHNIWRSASTILFVGYQAEGTLGRKIVDGADTVSLFGEEVCVNAEIRILKGTSGHADQKGLLSWASAFDPKPKGIFVVHGEKECAEYFASKLSHELGIRAYAPALLEQVDLSSDDIPSSGDGPLRRRRAMMMDGCISRMEAAKGRLDRIVARMEERARGIDPADERSSQRLMKALDRISEEIDAVSERWE